MHLSRTAEYALRAMAQLALLDEGVALPAQDLSNTTAIPVAYLSKVMRKMVLAGLVNAHKGHGGGFALSRPPAKIRFSDVLAAAGIDARENDCAFGFARCNAKSPCPLHVAWKDLGDRFRSWALGTTLADVRTGDDRLIPLRLHKTT